MNGVSVDFWCECLKAAAKVHGKRMMGDSIEKFRAGLEIAEDAYKELPLESNERRGTKGDE